MTDSRPWYQDSGKLTEQIAAHGSISGAARANNTPGPTVQGWATKFGIKSGHKKTPGGGSGGVANIDGDIITHSLPAHPMRESSRTPDEVLVAHGFDPDEWDIVNIVDNYWQSAGEEGPQPLTQSKLTAKRRRPSGMIIPARTDDVIRKPGRARTATKGRPLIVALPSDQHCPHEDLGLDSCWLQWLRTRSVDRILGLGDILNLSKPSRHRPNLHGKHNDTANECFRAGHAWWRRTLEAAAQGRALEGFDDEGLVAEQLPGNHDLRVQIAAMERLPDAYDLKRHGEEHPWWDLEYMLGLDKLGVKFHRPEGEYHAAEVLLASGLVVTHGATAGPLGGAVKAAARHEGSRVQGHDHKQALTHVVRYRDGHAHVHLAVSGGTMARRDLGYQPDPDTQQGFAVAIIHADGSWNIELARYDDRRQSLYWRDEVITAA